MDVYIYIYICMYITLQFFLRADASYLVSICQHLSALRAATHCNVLQHTATPCNTLQHPLASRVSNMPHPSAFRSHGETTQKAKKNQIRVGKIGPTHVAKEIRKIVPQSSAQPSPVKTGKGHAEDGRRSGRIHGRTVCMEGQGVWERRRELYRRIGIGRRCERGNISKRKCG